MSTVQVVPTTSSTSAIGASSNTHRTLRISTRSSALAIAQTTLFTKLLSSHPLPSISNIPTSVHPIHTSLGDTDKQTDLHTLANTSGKSLWTEDLEDALVKGQVDVIVHSLKDVPTKLPEGLCVCAVGEREEGRDCIVLRQDDPFTSIPSSTSTSATTTIGSSTARSLLSTLQPGSVIGTSSLRRTAMLRRAHPHLQIASVRGNVGTRLRKLDTSIPHPVPPPPAPEMISEKPQTTSEDPSQPQQQHYTAIVLAAAGLTRLNLSHRISSYLSREPDGMMAAVGQGALGLEWRADDEWIGGIIEALCDFLGSEPSADPDPGPDSPSQQQQDQQAAAGADTKHPKQPSRGWKVRWECAAERAMLGELEGGCSVPIGVESMWLDSHQQHQYLHGDHNKAHSTTNSKDKGSANLKLLAMVVSPDGSQCVETSNEAIIASDQDAESLGRHVAKSLVDKGAGEILKEVNLMRMGQ